MAEEELNGHFDDGVHQNDEENGIKAELDDEKVTVKGNDVEKGTEEKGLALSSDDEEAKVIVTEKTDDEKSDVINKEENEVSNLIVEEYEAAEIESKPVTEELKVVEVIEEDISEAWKTSVQDEREVVITEESQTVEPVVLKLADDHIESAEEDTNQKLQSAEEDSAKIGTDEPGHKAEVPETNGNPQIISISARTMQPTSWKGCCGLLEVFKRGDR